jgi:hypothetical protein
MPQRRATEERNIDRLAKCPIEKGDGRGRLGAHEGRVLVPGAVQDGQCRDCASFCQCVEKITRVLYRHDAVGIALCDPERRRWLLRR